MASTLIITGVTILVGLTLLRGLFAPPPPPPPAVVFVQTAPAQAEQGGSGIGGLVLMMLGVFVIVALFAV